MVTENDFTSGSASCKSRLRFLKKDFSLIHFEYSVLVLMISLIMWKPPDIIPSICSLFNKCNLIKILSVYINMVKYRKSKSIISYRILVTKRSEGESACLPNSPRLTYRPATNAQKLRVKTRTPSLICEKCLKTKI